MPIQYSQRRARREQLLAALPEELRPLVSLRNVETVVRLPKPALATLVRAVPMGLHSLPVALRLLSAQPGLSPEHLILACRIDTPQGGDRDTLVTAGGGNETPATVPKVNLSEPGDLITDNDASARMLADTIRRCFPHVTPISAESLATVPPLSNLRPLAAAICLAISAAEGSEITTLIAETLLREALVGLQDGQVAGKGQNRVSAHADR